MQLRYIIEKCEKYIKESDDKNKRNFILNTFRSTEFSKSQIKIFQELVKNLEQANGEEKASKTAIQNAYYLIQECELEMEKTNYENVFKFTTVNQFSEHSTGYKLLEEFNQAVEKNTIIYGFPKDDSPKPPKIVEPLEVKADSSKPSKLITTIVKKAPRKRDPLLTFFEEDPEKFTSREEDSPQPVSTTVIPVSVFPQTKAAKKETIIEIELLPTKKKSYT